MADRLIHYLRSRIVYVHILQIDILSDDDIHCQLIVIHVYIHVERWFLTAQMQIEQCRIWFVFIENKIAK